MKYLIGVILSLSITSAMAGAIPLNLCKIDGEFVRYRSVPSTFNNSYIRHGKQFVASAGVINGQGVISYNAGLMSTKPTEWTSHVMLHECAHLKFHMSNEPNVTTEEYEADCHAAFVLKNEHGYGDKEFNIIINAMLKILPTDRIQAFKSCIAP